MLKAKGFALIELLIVVVLLAILLSLAVPGYLSYIQQTRRHDGIHLLMLNAHRLKRCFTLEGVYNGSCVTRSDSVDGYYTLESELGSNYFLLTAQPVAGTSQAKDNDCLALTYDHTGKQSAVGPLMDECW